MDANDAVNVRQRMNEEATALRAILVLGFGAVPIEEVVG